jgi:uncharacterized spore protein YtfJ
MDINKVFSQLKDLIHSGAGVQFSFGTPSKIGDTAIIPVARVSFAFGGGGGASAAKGNKKDKKAAVPNAENSSETPKPEAADGKEEIKNPDFGGGGGGSIKTDPVGIYTIKGDKVKFHPVVSVKEILAIFVVVSLLLIKLTKLRRIKKKVK